MFRTSKINLILNYPKVNDEHGNTNKINSHKTHVCTFGYHAICNLKGDTVKYCNGFFHHANKYLIIL